jgi:hypothetical protein
LVLKLIVPLDIIKKEQQRLAVWIKGLIAEPGPDDTITPRHRRERNNLLAMQICHGFSMYLTEEQKTIQNGYDQGLVFAAGDNANDADGLSMSVFSNNHVVIGLSRQQLSHRLMNHLRGLGQIKSLSTTVIELASGRRQQEQKRRLDLGVLAAQKILKAALDTLKFKTLAERSVQALKCDVVVFCVLCVCVLCVCVCVCV